MKRLGNFFKALAVIAAAGAAANAGALIQTGNFDPKAIAGASAGGALVGLAAWLLKSPLPTPGGETK